MGNSDVVGRRAIHILPARAGDVRGVPPRGRGGAACLSGQSLDKNVVVHLVRMKAGNRVVATFWRHPLARFTLLYSHSNAGDLGQMLDLFLELRAHLHINIMNCSSTFDPSARRTQRNARRQPNACSSGASRTQKKRKPTLTGASMALS
ncbi:hypothetical protein Cni_G02940 [Canna indica]|uniref:Uncharacterized protein n=1 Tax=Canna indica TaxID=4628 RepID=A0AAQ3Q0Z6_9LILI|nr:hypothetical protein Cni_G02940 [Canna indica]